MGFREEILKRVEKARDLPTLPTIFVKMDKLMSNRNSSAHDVAKIMKDDFALTARVLRVANSVAFAGTEKITSMSQAVSRMGFKQISEITKSLSLMSMFKSSGAVNPQRFWCHSLSVASAAEIVPRSLGRMVAEPESLFTAGLLHDIGVFVLDLFGGDLYRSVATSAVETGRPLHEIELQLMGTDHAEIGGALMTRWGIPDTIMESVLNHHKPMVPSTGALPVGEAVKIANLICNDIGVENGVGIPAVKIPEDKWWQYGIDAANISAVTKEIHAVVTRTTVMLASTAS